MDLAREYDAVRLGRARPAMRPSAIAQIKAWTALLVVKGIIHRNGSRLGIELRVRLLRVLRAAALAAAPALAGAGNGQTSRFENRASDADTASPFTIPGFGGGSGAAGRVAQFAEALVIRAAAMGA